MEEVRGAEGRRCGVEEGVRGGLVTGGWGTHKGRGRQETGADQSAAGEE